MRWVASNTDTAGNTGFLGWVTAANEDGSTTLTRRFVDDVPAGAVNIVVDFDAPTSASSLALSVVDALGETLACKFHVITPGPTPAPEHASFHLPLDGEFTVKIDAGSFLYLRELAVDTGRRNKFGVTAKRVHALVSHVSLDESPVAEVDTVFGGGGLQRKVRVADVENWIEDVSAVVDLRLSKRSTLTEQAQSTLNHAAAAVIITGAAAYLVDAAFPANSSVNDSGAYGQVLWSRYRTDLEELAAELDKQLQDSDSLAGGTSARAGGYFPPPTFTDVLGW